MRTARARQRIARLRRQQARAPRPHLAELLCRWHLRLRGWRIVARDWRCPSGEIDILARRGKVLAIIEVKSRARSRQRRRSAVAPRQRRRIARAAVGVSVVAAGPCRADAAIRRDAGRAAARCRAISPVRGAPTSETPAGAGQLDASSCRQRLCGRMTAAGDAAPGERGHADGRDGGRLARSGEKSHNGAGIAVALGGTWRGHCALPSIVALAAVLGCRWRSAAVSGCWSSAAWPRPAAAAMPRRRNAASTALASDFAIKTDIRQAFASTDPRLEPAVTMTVYEGRVLLTGQVPTPDLKVAAGPDRRRATRGCARSMTRSRWRRQRHGLWDGAKDAWIGTQVRSEMVLDPDIRSVNYTIDTENGSVYLIGSARSPDRARPGHRHRALCARRASGSSPMSRCAPGAPVAARSRPPRARPPLVCRRRAPSARRRARLRSRCRSCDMGP